MFYLSTWDAVGRIQSVLGSAVGLDAVEEECVEL